MKFSKVSMMVVAAIFGCLVLSAQTGRTLSLREIVEIGHKNNLDVTRAFLNRQRASVNLNQSRWNMIPSLGGRINHTLNSGRSIDLFSNSYVNQNYTSASYSLNADVTLFNGFRLWNLLRAGQGFVESGNLELQQAKDDLTLDIIVAYLDILTSQDRLGLAKIQTEQIQQQVNRLQTLNEQGAILPSELSDLQGQLSGNKINEIDSRNALLNAKLSLSQLLNIPFDSTIQVERVPVEQFDMNYAATPDSIYALAIQQLASLRAPTVRRQSFEKLVKAERGNLFPSIGFGGGISTNFSSTGRDASNNKIGYYDQLSNNYGTGLGIGVTIPILNNFFLRNRVKLAKIDLKLAEVLEQSTHVQIKQLIERDYYLMQASVNRYRALVEQVTALTQSFQAAEARFNAGVGNSFDFLTVRNNLDRANINLIVARYDYALRTKILDFYQGRPLW